jgi:dynein heavy chain, axonemal
MVRQHFFIDKLINFNNSLILVGPTGSGKTTLINNYLAKLPKNKFIINSFNYSNRTPAAQVQNLIMRNNYVSINGKCNIVYIDDLHSPRQNKDYSQSSIELLRNLIDHKFCYKK